MFTVYMCWPIVLGCEYVQFRVTFMVIEARKNMTPSNFLKQRAKLPKNPKGIANIVLNIDCTRKLNVSSPQLNH